MVEDLTSSRPRASLYSQCMLNDTPISAVTVDSCYDNHQKRIQFSRSVVSDSLWPHESQHARPPCPSPTSGAYSNSCPLRQWCHPAISSSVIPLSSCPQSFPSLGSFPMSQLFTWGGQSTGVSALASFLPKKSQGWSPLEKGYKDRKRVISVPGPNHTSLLR